ncbi:MAG: UbiX family flavin prenyltransferase [Nisaea sp.]|jgi:4-hydroxy-3-polyprenylbenzoate decarboxylase|nr:UbiX family flavin prenyltransferase [Nisaea sp.]MEC7971534.1 UbiX family flavin prenyltransferase [Pseudomonadota bacterium]|tara:strand:- start:178 stop:765 length:588 start_codon:yes stop_codon:yes gene_type:complete
MTISSTSRLIIGISGASGIIYGLRILEILKNLEDNKRPELHLVMSRSAEVTLAYETKMKTSEVHQLADIVHANKDISATIASGSFKTDGMIIAPCSMKTLAEIASGVTSNLLSRAADVTLKERRRLVCLTRETPLHSGHLKNMLALSEMGGIVAPPVPAFYTKPKTIDDIVEHTAGRVLDLFDIEAGLVKRWKNC